MNPADLPDDLAQWPTNPYLLFGIDRGAETNDLRRIYVRLVKRFKPEQYPEHFRRIREAYESLQSWHAMPSFAVSNETEEEEGPPPESISMPRRREDAWELALHGDLGAAYERLRQRVESTRHDPTAYAQLYWLLRLAPELDMRGNATAWLTAGLMESRLEGPLAELYRRELLRRPSEGLDVRCQKLLSCGATPRRLLDLLTWRWHAVSHYADWDKVIWDDLVLVREHCVRTDDESWARMLLAALDLLLWSRGKTCVQLIGECQRGLNQLAHLHERLAWELDRRDLLLEVSAAYHVRNVAPPQFLTLASLSWRRPFVEYRAALLAWIGRLIAEPVAGLAVLDHVNKYGSALLAQFKQMLDQLDAQPHAPEDELGAPHAEIANRFERLVTGQRWLGYPALRPRALHFFLETWACPDDLAHAISNRDHLRLSKDEHLGDRLAGDWPLRLLCRAHRLFWA